MQKRKVIWSRSEIPIGDYLMSKQDNLRSEFMANYSSLKEAATDIGHPTFDRPDHSTAPTAYSNLVQTREEGKNYFRPKLDAWRGVAFKYTLVDKDNNIKRELDEDHEFAKRFPTAYNLMKELGEDCPIAEYSILAPNSAIFRHTGPENREGKFIRIHIPLIIPAGDVFLEVDGEEVTWADLFGFNNQYAHSAYNLTNEWRMIFLIDVERTRAGLPPGEPYNPRYTPRPFMRRL